MQTSKEEELIRQMEDTFQQGFSHGITGGKLRGKKLVASLTTGAPGEFYYHDVFMGYEIDEFLPFIKAACWFYIV